ncbi:MAG: hypothetical protein K0S47_1097 [Herbinix sp.]|jgi:hypothetical protein|nr:hypothetical protein [Herbinix sp.]
MVLQLNHRHTILDKIEYIYQDVLFLDLCTLKGGSNRSNLIASTDDKMRTIQKSSVVCP